MNAKKYVAEFIGSFLLVFIGCASVVSAVKFAGAGAPNFGVAGIVGVGLTFGLALVAIAFALGPISGGHVNSAVTLGFLAARKISVQDAVAYIIAQCAGALVAALCLYAIVGDKSVLGQNMPGAWGVRGALIFEAVSTFLFFLVIYGSAAGARKTSIAALPIGFYLAVSHFAGIPISGSSVNPSRSLGPALVVGGDALSNVWIYFAGPIAGAVAAGLLSAWLHED